MQNISDLLPMTPLIDQLGRIIPGVAALAFFLGALAVFSKTLVSRIDRVIDRSRFINGISENDPSKSFFRAELPRLKLRAALLNRSLFCGILAAILTALVIIVAFIGAMFQVPLGYGVATLFVAAVLMFCAALVEFAREMRIVLQDDDLRM